MSRDKQIEEMVMLMTEGARPAVEDAEALYNAGYRKAEDIYEDVFEGRIEIIKKGYNDKLKKASEVAREIFEEIEDVLNNIGYFDELDFETLKKKYTGSEDTE